MNSRRGRRLGPALAAALVMCACQAPPDARAPVREPRDFSEFVQGDTSSGLRAELVRTLPLDGATGWQVDVICTAEEGCAGVARATVEYSSEGRDRFVDLSNPLELTFEERFVLKRVEQGTMAVEAVKSVTIALQPIPSGHHPRFKE